MARMFEYVRLVEQFLGEPIDKLRLPIMDRAVTIAATLAQHTSNPETERLAYDMCLFMHPTGHPPAAFWATDLGADIAWHIGYPHQQVPMWAAAAVLRVSRVTIWRIQQTGPINAVRLRDLARSRNT